MGPFLRPDRPLPFSHGEMSPLVRTCIVCGSQFVRRFHVWSMVTCRKWDRDRSGIIGTRRLTLWEWSGCRARYQHDSEIRPITPSLQPWPTLSIDRVSVSCFSMSPRLVSCCYLFSHGRTCTYNAQYRTRSRATVAGCPCLLDCETGPLVPYMALVKHDTNTPQWNVTADIKCR